MLSLNRTKVMSIPEFLQECERERLEKQYNLTNLDKIIGHIKRNKRLYRRLVFNVALTCLLMNIDLSIAYANVVNVDDAIRKIEEITDQLLRLAQVVGSSVNLVFVFKNVVVIPIISKFSLDKAKYRVNKSSISSPLSVSIIILLFLII